MQRNERGKTEGQEGVRREGEGMKRGKVERGVERKGERKEFRSGVCRGRGCKEKG